MDTTINIVSLIIGIVSLVVAFVAQKQAADVKQALEVKYSELYASNQLIINSARNENNSPPERIQFILGAAESQKNLLIGLKTVLKFRYWDLWDRANDAHEQ